MKSIFYTLLLFSLMACSKELSLENQQLVQVVFSKRNQEYQLVMNRKLPDTCYAVLVGSTPVRIWIIPPGQLLRTMPAADSSNYRLAGISSQSGQWQFRIVNE